MNRLPQIQLFADERVVVNFAGGGGTCEGIKWAIGRSPDVAINHDAEALAMHRRNHPETRHLKTDVFEVEPGDASDGKPIGLAWFSPDCTDFSKAKGGRPFRDPRKSRRRRGLAWVVVKYARAPLPVKPRVMILENVEEFRLWGALRADGRPDPRKVGRNFRRFKAAIVKEGFSFEYRELRAKDYGSRTSRKRLFIIMRRDGLPVVWPKPTHGPGAAAPLPTWDPLPARSSNYRTAAECIDFSIPVPSIFLTPAEAREWARVHSCGIPKRPLADNSLRRVARGVFQFVIENPDPFVIDQCGNPFLVPVVHTGDARVHSIEEPMRTIVASDREFALVAPTLIQVGYGERTGQKPRTLDLFKPLGTVVASNKYALVAAFLAKHNGGHEATGQRLGVPADTITTVDQKALVTSHLVKLYGTCRHGAELTAPMPTVTAHGNHIAEVRAFLVKFYSSRTSGNELTLPLDTVTTIDRFGLIVVTIAGEQYVIADIGMRMLTPRELYRAQGFLDSYVINEGQHPEHGLLMKFTKRTQTRLCGNSVPPHLAAALVCANLSAESYMPTESVA
jgi:DNA (cytosine-5)-methyltransferase 1